MILSAQSIKALIAKLGDISDHAYPYPHSSLMGDGVGREPIVAINRPVVKRTRAAARAAVKASNGLIYE